MVLAAGRHETPLWDPLGKGSAECWASRYDNSRAAMQTCDSNWVTCDTAFLSDEACVSFCFMTGRRRWQSDKKPFVSHKESRGQRAEFPIWRRTERPGAAVDTWAPAGRQHLLCLAPALALSGPGASCSSFKTPENQLYFRKCPSSHPEIIHADGLSSLAQLNRDSDKSSLPCWPPPNTVHRPNNPRRHPNCTHSPSSKLSRPPCRSL